MDNLLKKYKSRIESLAISQSDKDKLCDNFFSEIQFKLANSFVNTLTDEQKKLLAYANSDEELVQVYLQLLNKSIDIPEFLDYIEQVYTDSMIKAISEIPIFNSQTNNSST